MGRRNRNARHPEGPRDRGRASASSGGAAGAPGGKGGGRGAARAGWAFYPDASLDLHRMTTDEAESELVRFLDRSFLAGHRKVLVIHGAKLLAAVVARTLRAHPLVEAQMSDNPGATRVFLEER